MANRAKFIDERGPTSNSDVSIVPFHGWLLSMNESPIVHLHDPVTLEAVHEVDLRQSNKFDGLQIATMTAHGMFDINDGSFWNTAIGVDERSGSVPRVGIFVVKFPNATRSGPDGPFINRSSVDDILESIVVSDIIYVSNNPLDLNVPYYHMFAMTENYVVLPFTSVALDTTHMYKELMNARPMVTSLKFDPARPFTYHIFNKNTFKLEERVFETNPGICLHTINAFETSEGDIHLDTVIAGSGDVYQMYGYDVINATGSELVELFESILPIGTAVSYTFKMSEIHHGHKPIYTPAVPLFDPHEETDHSWDGMLKNGLEFPILDFGTKTGVEYEHFWANGFGSFMPDRLDLLLYNYK